MFSIHNVVLSERHLKRIQKQLGLGRRKGYTPAVDLVNVIEKEIKGSGQLHGYRWMTQKCKSLSKKGRAHYHWSAGSSWK